MSDKIEIEFVRQPTATTCVHACLSMVTGVPVGDLIERFGGCGLSDNVVAIVLTELGIMPILQSGLFGTAFPEIGVYLVTVPSLNRPGGNHQVLWVLTEDEEASVLLDPNEGRDGVKAYPRDCIYRKDSPLQGYSEVMLLRVMPGHHGNERRKALCRRRKSAEVPA